MKATTIKLPTADELAKAFSAVLKTWFTPEEQRLTVERNKTEEHAGVCHSHDFCDANMAMLEALEKFGVELDIQDNDQNALWNSAWGIAKQNGFWFVATPVVIVARDADGKEVARQTVKDEAMAVQLMFARNRPLRNELTFPKWAIETIS